MERRFASGKVNWELYDLSEDIFEEENLAEADSARLTELLKIWETSATLIRQGTLSIVAYPRRRDDGNMLRCMQGSRTDG